VDVSEFIFYNFSLSDVNWMYVNSILIIFSILQYECHLDDLYLILIIFLSDFISLSKINVVYPTIAVSKKKK